jgi:hypothetical protein
MDRSPAEREVAVEAQRETSTAQGLSWLEDCPIPLARIRSDDTPDRAGSTRRRRPMGDGLGTLQYLMP